MGYSDEHFEHLASCQSDSELLIQFMRLAGLTEKEIGRISLRLGKKMNLRKILGSHYGVLARDLGLGERVAFMLKMLNTLIVRYQKTKLENRNVISDTTDLYNYLALRLSNMSEEHIILLLLDARNHLISEHDISTGIANHVALYPGLIMKKALELGASAFIVVHNHPSGNTSPSPQDIESTVQLHDIASRLNITFHDHLIVGRDEILSLRSKGVF